MKPAYSENTSNDKYKKHVLRWFNSIQVRNNGTTQQEKNRIERTKLQAQPKCRAERSLRIGNITSLIECTCRLFTASICHKQRRCDYKIEKIRIPTEIPTRQNWKCCRLGLIEPFYGRYYQKQTTIYAP
jgi:hypothetical protein